MVVVGIHIGSVFEVVHVEAVDVFLCNLATRGSLLVAVDGTLVVLDLVKSVGLNGLLVVLDFVKSVGLVVSEAVCLYVSGRAVGLWLVFFRLRDVSLRPLRIGGGVCRVVGTLNPELVDRGWKTVRLDLVE